METTQLTMRHDSMDHAELVPIFFASGATAEVVKIYCLLHVYVNDIKTHNTEQAEKMLIEVAGETTGLPWQRAACVIEGTANISPLVAKCWLSILNELFDQRKGNPGYPHYCFLMGLVIGLFKIAVSREVARFNEYLDVPELAKILIELLKNLCTFQPVSEVGLAVNSISKDKKFIEILTSLVRQQFSDHWLFKKGSVVAQFKEAMKGFTDSDLNLVGIEVVDAISYGDLSGMTPIQRLSSVRAGK